MKKIVSLLTAFCIVISLCTPAVCAMSATEEPISNVEITNHSKYLSDTDIEVLKDGIYATYTTSTGVVVPLNCKATVEDVVSNDLNPRLIGNQTYAITVTAEKREANADSVNTDDVSAVATITMVWTDVPGIANTIDRLYGNIEIIRGTLHRGLVSYGNSHNRPLNRPNFSIGTNTSFDKTVSYTSTSLTGSVHACYQSWFKEYELALITVCVEPSIFD